MRQSKGSKCQLDPGKPQATHFRRNGRRIQNVALQIPQKFRVILFGMSLKPLMLVGA